MAEQVVELQGPPAGGERDVARIFALQQARRWEIAATGPAERIAKLQRLRKAVESRRPALASALTADFGKSPVEAELTEVHPLLAEIAHASKHLATWMRPRRVATPTLLAGARSELRSEPRGVVLILAPWNYPVGLTLSPLVSAVAAGNCAMLKPATDKVPATSRVLRELVASCFDESEVALLEGGAALGDALLAQPFDHIFFTGSTRIGRHVMQAAARHLSSVTLELGGKSPVVVDQSADLQLAAERIAWGKFINAGQTCVAPDYVLVHESRAQELVERLRGAIARFYGEGEEDRQQSPDFARAVDGGAFRRLRDLHDRAVAAGAQVQIGGRFDEATRYVAPTVLTGVLPGSPLLEAEIFGPLLPLVTFPDRAAAVDLIRAGGKPLALYVFAREREAAEEILRATTAGGSCVNEVVVHLANPHLPFGGVGPSGQGSYHGHHGFRAFSHERAVLRQRVPGVLSWLFPPYRGRRQSLARRAMRLFE